MQSLNNERYSSIFPKYGSFCFWLKKSCINATCVAYPWKWSSWFVVHEKILNFYIFSSMQLVEGVQYNFCLFHLWVCQPLFFHLFQHRVFFNISRNSSKYELKPKFLSVRRMWDLCDHEYKRIFDINGYIRIYRKST